MFDILKSIFPKQMMSEESAKNEHLFVDEESQTEGIMAEIVTELNTQRDVDNEQLIKEKDIANQV